MRSARKGKLGRRTVHSGRGRGQGRVGVRGEDCVSAPRASVGARGSGSYSENCGAAPPSPCFSQVLILNVVNVLCFHTLLQVLILKDVRPAAARTSFRARQEAGTAGPP